MSVTNYTIDQIMSIMGDAYDAAIYPFTIFRGINNKIWAFIQAQAAGYALINDMIVAQSMKFDPANCTDDDLVSTALLVGAQQKAGKQSMLTIGITNGDVNTRTLLADTYTYLSTLGEMFSLTIPSALTIPAGTTVYRTAFSNDIGSYYVSALSTITLVSLSGLSIDSNLSFSCQDNTAILGYQPETNLAFRQRVLYDTTRQDSFAELELAIRNLPNILECNLLFNPSDTNVTYDGFTIPPFYLLVVVNGVPDSSLAATVAQFVPYLTVQDPSNPGWLFNISDTHFVGSILPIYYTTHKQSDFAISVQYRFDPTKIVQTAESLMNTALMAAYANMTRHVDTLTVSDFITMLNNMNLSSVQILSVTITPAGGSAVSYLDFLKTRLPNLTGVTFTGIAL